MIPSGGTLDIAGDGISTPDGGKGSLSASSVWMPPATSALVRSGPRRELEQLQAASVARAARLAWIVAMPIQPRSHPAATRDSTVWVSLAGLFAATMTATATGPRPAAVNAVAAA